ncbi:MAG: hypothetical protein FWG13_08385 [Leptospirales bacterium]|nr:hypothetical protein [Leptospirales bacterium]
MKNITASSENKAGSFYLRRIVFLLLGCLLLSTPAFSFSFTEKIQETFKSAKEIPENMKRTFKSIEEFIDGVNSFVGKIHSVAAMIGFKPIALLIIIFFLSSGLTSVGVPKGKASFLTSLALADTVWVLWKMSFSDTQFAEYLSIAKTNLILLLPFIVIFSIHKGRPFIAKSLRRIKARLSGEELKLRRKEITSLSRLLLEENVKLHNQIQENIDNDELYAELSPDAKKLIDEIRKLLDLLEKKNKRKINAELEKIE